MVTVFGVFFYLVILIIFVFIENHRNKEWKKISFLKSRWQRSTIACIYCISFVYMVFFTAIDVIIVKENLGFTFSITGLSILMELIAFLCSRISIVITDKEVVKNHLLGKTVIYFKKIDRIDIGYYIKIKSRNKFIIIEQRSYDTEIKLIKRRLFEISLGS